MKKPLNPDSRVTTESSAYEMLADIREHLLRAYGNRFEDVILYGSAASGRMTEDSDIDIIILLKSAVRLLPDLETALRALSSLSQKYNHPISPKPVDLNHYDTMDVPLFSMVRRRGLRLT